MYAIISEGGRQYKVREGEELHVDFREDAKIGSEIRFDRVLAISQEGDGGVTLGDPVVSGASVTAEVIDVEQGDKIHIQKMRRRKNYRRRTGHRQWYTKIRVGQISVG